MSDYIGLHLKKRFEFTFNSLQTLGVGREGSIKIMQCFVIPLILAFPRLE